jgi:peptide subunit release factor 1 (eRF1)
VLHEHEREQERTLVSQLSDAASSEGQAVIGLSDTLAAASDGRVQTLVVADGVTTEGVECQSCGYVTAERADTCPRCGGAVDAVPDVVERAVEKVLESNGRINMVFADAREWLVARGGLGAVLRY